MPSQGDELVLRVIDRKTSATLNDTKSIRVRLSHIRSLWEMFDSKMPRFVVKKVDKIAKELDNIDRRTVKIRGEIQKLVK